MAQLLYWILFNVVQNWKHNANNHLFSLCIEVEIVMQVRVANDFHLCCWWICVRCWGEGTFEGGRVDQEISMAPLLGHVGQMHSLTPTKPCNSSPIATGSTSCSCPCKLDEVSHRWLQAMIGVRTQVLISLPAQWRRNSLGLLFQYPNVGCNQERDDILQPPRGTAERGL